MLDQTGIAMTPGTDFDPQRGKSYLRVSYSGATDEIMEAMRRLKEWMPHSV